MATSITSEPVKPHDSLTRYTYHFRFTFADGRVAYRGCSTPSAWLRSPDVLCPSDTPWRARHSSWDIGSPEPVKGVLYARTTEILETVAFTEDDLDS